MAANVTSTRYNGIKQQTTVAKMTKRETMNIKLIKKIDSRNFEFSLADEDGHLGKVTVAIESDIADADDCCEECGEPLSDISTVFYDGLSSGMSLCLAEYPEAVQSAIKKAVAS